MNPPPTPPSRRTTHHAESRALSIGALTTDWQAIRERAADFPEAAFDFVREGLGHTITGLFGTAEPTSSEHGTSRHVTGQQLCMGLREFARSRYGALAGAVLRHWGIRGTEDFGVMVYAMIDRGEMRCSPQDRFDDFRAVFNFDECFPLLSADGTLERPHRTQD